MQKTKTEIAKEYIEKYAEIYRRTQKQFSKRFVATVIYNENPDIFSGVEDARGFVRYSLNCNGNQNSQISKDFADRFAFINEQITDTPNSEPFIFPKVNNKILITNDWHSLFYDKRAVETAINYGIKQKCNAVLINGDFLDFYGFSRFTKNPRISSEFIQNEQEWGVEMLKLLQDTFGYVVYKQGNHDKRREEQLFDLTAKNPDIIDACTLEDYLQYEGSNVRFVKDYQTVKMGKLNAIHGHEVGMSGGINAARNIFLKTYANTISGHSHIKQEQLIKDINGDVHMSYKVGCLCQLDARYAIINQWTHGAASVEIEPNGDFLVDNKIIHNGKIY